MRKIPSKDIRPLDVACHGGIPYQANGRPLLDFSSNLNPLGPPPTVLRAIRRHLQAVSHYPDPGCRELRERLAAYHDIDADQIVVGNGSNELIHAIARSIPLRRAALVEPTYTEYMMSCLDSGVRREHWLAEGPHFDLQPFDPRKVDLVWLCNPNNPTGRLWPHEKLVSWIQSFPEKTFVIDESFLPFREDEPEHSLIGATRQLKNVIVLRSMTKLFTLPGLRLGYLVANASKYQILYRGLPPWSVNALAQIAGIAALEDQDFVKRTHRWLCTERDWLFRQLRLFPFSLDPIPTEANFILIRLRGIQSEDLARRLLTNGIVIRKAGWLGLDSHGQFVRVAIRTRGENQQLVDALKTILVSENGHQ